MRPVLVLLNGLPGSGKSTLARAWADRAPLRLALDLDVLRGMLGDWRTAGTEAGLAARAMALAAIAVHLRAGHDVVVPQYLRRAEFADRLAACATDADAAFLECALIVAPHVAGGRLAARGTAGGEHEGTLTEPIEAVSADFERFLATRPDTIRLPDDDGLQDRFDRAIDSARTRCISERFPADADRDPSEMNEA